MTPEERAELRERWDYTNDVCPDPNFDCGHGVCQDCRDVHSLLDEIERLEGDLHLARERALVEALEKIEQLPWPDSESPYALIARAALEAELEAQG